MAEMKAHRHMLMEDYSISPELVAKCGNDITNNCKNLNKKGNHPGEVIHCLMRAAMDRKVTDEECIASLQTLLQVQYNLPILRLQVFFREITIFVHFT